MGDTRTTTQTVDAPEAAKSSHVGSASQRKSRAAHAQEMDELRLFREISANGMASSPQDMSDALRSVPPASRARLLRQFQRHYGNTFVQQMVTQTQPGKKERRRGRENEESIQAQPRIAETPEPTTPTQSAGRTAPAAQKSGQSSEETETLQKESMPEEVSTEEGAAPSESDTEKAPASPEEDPAFQVVVKRAKGVAAEQRAHPPADAEAAAAQAAASGPPNEVTSVAAAGQVQKMDAQEPQPFDRAAFKKALLGKIKVIDPKTLEDADEFKDSGKLDAVKQDMTSKVGESKEQAQGNIAQTVEEKPDTSGINPKPVTPLRPTDAGPAPASINAAQAAPKPKSASETSLQEGSQSLDQQMADAEITEDQLENSNEPSFKSAAESKKTAQTHAQEAPQAYRQQEQDILSGAEGEAQTDAQKGLEAMHGKRGGLLEQVMGAQTDTKGVDEQKRAEVSKHIESIYQRTKEDVEKRLNQLDKEINRAFDEGAAAAQQSFEDYVERRMNAYKKKRYEGLGKLLWLTDKLLGLPSVVNVFYRAGRSLYIRMMDDVLENITTIVETGLNEAKAEITRGKQEIQDYVTSLPADLKKVGKEAAQEIQSKFDELEQSVNDKQSELIDSLARKYHENLQKVDARIEEMKAANTGLVDAAFDAIVGVIKTIIELKNMLLRILSKVASVVVIIITDPIGFLGNLIKGLSQGFQNFASNILTHLQAGFIAWLTGSLGPMGIQIPEDVFSLKGIFSLVMQVLGLTWDYIRKKAVKLLGEPVVKALEKGFEIFQILITKGPAGLWEYVKEQFSDLKEMVIEQIKSLLITQVIMAGVKWLMGLLSPVGAFIKAAIAIYDIVMFFIERARQILELIESVVDAVTAIARGSIGGAAKLVENALAKAIPMVIGLLASLLGVSGLAKKVQNIIKKVRKRIDKAIDKMIMKAKKMAVKLLRKSGAGKDISKVGADEKKAVAEGEYDGQIGKSVTFTAAGESHRLWVVIKGRDATVMMMSSSRKSASRQLGKYEKRAKKLLEGDRLEDVLGFIENARSILNKLNTIADNLAAKLAKDKTKPKDIAKQDNAVEKTEEELAAAMTKVQAELGFVLSPELKKIKDDLKKPKSKTYFNKKVRELGPQAALKLFKTEMARSATTYGPLQSLRDKTSAGPNITASPTVGILKGTIPKLGAVDYEAISGSPKIPSKLRLGAVTPFHAEGKLLAQLANSMENKGALGGRATIYVDKPPCGYCRVVLPSIKKQYEVKYGVISPSKQAT